MSEIELSISEAETAIGWNTISRVSDGVVVIWTQEGMGSGFAIGPNVFLTARHVVEGSDAVKIYTKCGYTFDSTEIICHPIYDLAIVKISESVGDFSPLKLDVASNVSVGDKVFAVGTPRDFINFNLVTMGHIAALNRNAVRPRVDPKNEYPGWGNVFVVDMTLWHGNSGCPIFNVSGEVIGVFVGGYMPVINYCIPVSVINDWRY
jgi:serine protease Do